MTFGLAELAARVGGEVVGDGGLRLTGVAALDDATPEQVSFFSNRKYRVAFQASRAGAVVVEPGEDVPAGRTVVRVANAYLAFAKIATLFHPPPEALPEIAPGAEIHPTARVHPGAQVMPLASVGAGAEVGARTILFPGVHVGPEARVGEDCILYSNVVIRERCRLGNRVILQPGVVIGADGFGFAFDPEGEGQGPRHYKFPQVGIVVVEDDVEIGANTCVDRATTDSTRIGDGTKLDNLVQIGHNVNIGRHCIIVAQVGVAGSTELEDYVTLGGQAGIAGHLRLEKGAVVAAQSGVSRGVKSKEVVSGYPAIAHGAWKRVSVLVQRLPQLFQKTRELEDRVEALERQSAHEEVR